MDVNKGVKKNVKVDGMDVPKGTKCKYYKCIQFYNDVCKVEEMEVRNKTVLTCIPNKRSK